MKKSLLLLFITVFGWTSLFGQAFHDLQSIRKLKKEDPAELTKIVEIILPYFTTDGKIQLTRLNNYLNDDLGKAISNYLSQKSKNIRIIHDFALNKKSIITDYFNQIDKDINFLNDIRAKYATKIPDLPASFSLEQIAEEYSNKPLENKLQKQKDLEGRSLTVDSLNFLELVNLRQETKVTGSDSVQILLNQLSSLTNLVDRIRVNRVKIFEVLKDPAYSSLLNDLYVFRTKSTTAETPVSAEANRQTAIIASSVPAIVHINAILSGSQQVSTLPSMRLPSQADMIDALVIFIAKRFSQEIAITFLDAVKQKSRTIALVSDLFPATIKLLSEGNSYEMPRLGSIWHYAIAQDINNIPLNLKSSAYIKDRIVKSRFAGHYPMFQDVVTMAELAKSGSSLPEILDMYNGGLCTFSDQRLLFAFDALNLVNNEFSERESKDFYWLKWARLAKLTDEDWDLMLKMIASKYNTKLFGDKVFSLPLDKFNDPKWVVFRKNIQQALMVLNQFEERRLALMNNQAAVQNTQIKTISFWECQQQLFSVLLNPQLVKDPLMASAVKFLQSALQIYKLQEEGNHPAMIRESVQLIQDLFPKETGRISELFVKKWRVGKEKYLPIYYNVDQYITGLDQLFIDLASTDNADEEKKVKLIKDLSAKFNFASSESTYDDLKKSFSTQFTSALRAVDKDGALLAVKGKNAVYSLFTMAEGGNLKNKLFAEGKSVGSFSAVLKTAEFFTDVMSASNSAQLSDVIKAYAMPPNSYKARRNSRFSIDIDAHIGLYGGAEWIGKKKPDSLNIKRGAPVWGLSAPIGFSFSWGHRHTTSKDEQISFLNRYGTPRTLSGNSYSLGISLIDIAAPLAYRLSNDDEEALPKSLSWSQIFSPGVHLRFGLKNTPFAISAGAQYTPQLRKTSLEVTDQQAYRAYLGLFFDMPLFNLYRR